MPIPALYVKDMPLEEGDELFDLPAACTLDNFTTMDGGRNFAEVRLGWNELGLGIQVEVRGKEQPPQATRPGRVPPMG